MRVYSDWLVMLCKLLVAGILMSNLTELLIGSTPYKVHRVDQSQLGTWSSVTGPGHPHSCEELQQAGP